MVNPTSPSDESTSAFQINSSYLNVTFEASFDEEANNLFITALLDLEPQQLLLFVQSFGIPVGSMSKLLLCLDQAVQTDSDEMESAVVDKSYMAQLIEVQHMRGATGGDQFYKLLVDVQVQPKPGKTLWRCDDSFVTVG